MNTILERNDIEVKGIDDMKAGRVVDYKEAMRILENRFRI